jgi:hypothetical protein
VKIIFKVLFKSAPSPNGFSVQSSCEAAPDSTTTYYRRWACCRELSSWRAAITLFELVAGVFSTNLLTARCRGGS